MDEYVGEHVLRWYERIERGILDFIEKVPFTDNNKQVQAPILVTYLMDTCGLLDSVFRDMTPDRVIIGEKSKQRSRCDIPDFAKLYAGSLDLPNTKSLLLVSPPLYLVPFKSWQILVSEDTYTSLDWWKKYNKLKHDRLRNIREATLGITIDALCALHQVLARYTDMLPMLVRRGWFPRGGYNPDYLYKTLANKTVKETFIVQTALFAVPVGAEQFPENIDNIRPSLFICKSEFHDFFDRW